MQTYRGKHMKFKFTLEELKKAIMTVEDVQYVCDFSDVDFKKGDLIYDRADDTYGYILEYNETAKTAVVGEGFAAEVGVLVSRLVKLKIFLTEKMQGSSTYKAGTFELE